MSNNLIELFKNTYSDTFIRQASGHTGESAQNISKAFGTILPALLGAMMLKVKTENSVKDLLTFISDNELHDQIIPDTNASDGALMSDSLLSKGTNVLKFLIGDNLAPMVDWIASEGGLKTSSASSILKMAAPVFMSFVGRFVRDSSLNPSGVKTLLLTQKEYVKHDIPAGLGELLGFADFEESPVSPNPNTSSNSSPESATNSGLSKFLPWLVLGLVSLGLFYFLQKGCNAPPVTETPQTTEKQDSLISPAHALGSSAERPDARHQPGSQGFKPFTLPDGAVLNAKPNTFTARMAPYLQGKKKPGKCFGFDEVSFESNSAILTQQSDPQLYHLLFMLNAYPGMAITICSSSDAKAIAVKNWLTYRNVASTRIQTKGLGEHWWISKNLLEVCVTVKEE